jgi:hypothetical protein
MLMTQLNEKIQVKLMKFGINEKFVVNVVAVPLSLLFCDHIISFWD